MNGGVLPALYRERFGLFGLSYLAISGHLDDDAIGDFVGEWWKREQETVPDPERDTRAEEERLAAARAQVAAIPNLAGREKARKRMYVSWTSPIYAVEYYDCVIRDDELLWPDGELWPIGKDSKR